MQGASLLLLPPAAFFLLLLLLPLLAAPSTSPPAAKFRPSLNDPEIPATNVNAPSTFTLVIGHTRPGYDLSRISFQIVSSDQRLLTNSQISRKLIKGSSSYIVSAFPTCCAGVVQLMANVTDVEGTTVMANYTLVIEPLKPRFGLR
jgi:hypothetical protein